MNFGVATGDIVLFSGNQLTGSIIKWFTNGKWNHMGIGVWIDNGKITRQSGQLCVLEMSNQLRFDTLTNLETRGPSFTHIYATKIRKYTTIGVRSMKEQYRSQFINNLLLVQPQYNNLKFSNRMTKFIQGWLGYQYDTNIYIDGVFCTEYASMIYSHCLGLRINEIFNNQELTNHTCTPLVYADTASDIFECELAIHHYTNDYFLNSVILLLVITLILILAAVVITILVDRAFRRNPVE